MEILKTDGRKCKGNSWASSGSGQKSYQEKQIGIDKDRNCKDICAMSSIPPHDKAC